MKHIYKIGDLVKVISAKQQNDYMFCCNDVRGYSKVLGKPLKIVGVFPTEHHKGKTVVLGYFRRTS